MIRFLRRLLVSVLLLGIAATGLLWLGWQYEWRRDPMPLLDRGPAAYRQVGDERMEVVTQGGESRIFHRITLEAGLSHPVRFTVSLPADSAGPLPAVLILGGFEIGQASLGYIAHHGRNALLAYEYPVGPSESSGLELVRRAPALRKAALEVPAQVEAILAWVSDQAWMDPRRVSLMGYSFGAMFLPACQRLTQAHGRRLGPAVLAYGGGDLPSLLETNLELRPPWLRRSAARVLSLALRPLEPTRHGPYLEGEFLLINGRRDALVPVPSALLLQDSLPEPKRVLWLEAGHMNPGDPLLLAQVIRLSRSWLRERGALEP